MDSYKTQGISRKDIRKIVRTIKERFQVDDVMYFPIVPFLECVLSMLFSDFQFECVPKEEMGNKHGETYPSKQLIRIREDVYLGTVAGNPRDRMTIAHEIGHLLHGNSNIALCRLEPGERIRAYEDPEWQANAFAGELLASSHLIRDLTVDEIQGKCGVSKTAEQIQLKSLSR